MFFVWLPQLLIQVIQCARSPSARLDKNTKNRDHLALAMELIMRQKTIDEEKFKVLGFEDLKFKLFRISPKQWVIWPTDENQLHFIQPAISDVTGDHYIERSLLINFCSVIVTSTMMMSSLLCHMCPSQMVLRVTT